jgi:YggT family protein
MAAIIGFIFFILASLLSLLRLAIIVSAILSWLFAFDVINHRNRFVNQLADLLDRIVSPVLAPLRAVIPNLGGIDITPIIALILITGVMNYLLPASQAALLSLLAY